MKIAFIKKDEILVKKSELDKLVSDHVYALKHTLGLERADYIEYFEKHLSESNQRDRELRWKDICSLISKEMKIKANDALFLGLIVDRLKNLQVKK